MTINNENKKTISITKDVWIKLNIVKVKKGFSNYSDLIEYLLKKIEN